MKIGVCGGIDKAVIAKKLGLDYIEENMAKLMKLSDGEFSETIKFYEKLDLPVYSFNCFFDKEVSIYDNIFFADLTAYGEKAFLRAKAIGGEICVVGSGKARNIPEGMAYADAEKRFVDTLSLLGEIADKHGIKLAIEPLNSTETNFINKVGEAADIAKKVNLTNVGSIVDFYHFNRENESDDALLYAGEKLIHTHIAAPDTEKRMPLEGDMPTITHWAELLKKINFTKAISIEAKYGNFENDLRDRLQYLAPFKVL